VKTFESDPLPWKFTDDPDKIDDGIAPMERVSIALRQGDIPFNLLDPRLLADLPAVAEHTQLMPRFQKGAPYMAADEAGTSCNEYAHGSIPSDKKCPILAIDPDHVQVG
jgi:hypothetical protein